MRSFIWVVNIFLVMMFLSAANKTEPEEFSQNVDVSFGSFNLSAVITEEISIPLTVKNNSTTDNNQDLMVELFMEGDLFYNSLINWKQNLTKTALIRREIGLFSVGKLKGNETKDFVFHYKIPLAFPLGDYQIYAKLKSEDNKNIQSQVCSGRIKILNLHKRKNLKLACLGYEDNPDYEFLLTHYDLIFAADFWLNDILDKLLEQKPGASVVYYSQYHNARTQDNIFLELEKYSKENNLENEKMFAHFSGDVTCEPRYEKRPVKVRGYKNCSTDKNQARIPLYYYNSYLFNLHNKDFIKFIASYFSSHMKTAKGNFFDGFVFDNLAIRLRTFHETSSLVYDLSRVPESASIVEYPDDSANKQWVDDNIDLLNAIGTASESAGRKVLLLGNISLPYRMEKETFKIIHALDLPVFERFIAYNGSLFEERVKFLLHLMHDETPAVIHAVGLPYNEPESESANMFCLSAYYLFMNPACFLMYTTGLYGQPSAGHKWFPALDFDIGSPLGAPSKLDSGTDQIISFEGVGRVWFRIFEKAVVFSRLSNENHGESSMVKIKLKNSCRILSQMGTLSPETNSIALKINQGVILVLAK